MTKGNLLTLLESSDYVTISVLGKMLKIRAWANGTYSVEDISSNDFVIFPTAYDLINNYMVMNLPLDSLIPWMNVTNVA